MSTEVVHLGPKTWFLKTPPPHNSYLYFGSMIEFCGWAYRVYIIDIEFENWKLKIGKI